MLYLILAIISLILAILFILLGIYIKKRCKIKHPGKKRNNTSAYIACFFIIFAILFGYLYLFGSSFLSDEKIYDIEQKFKKSNNLSLLPTDVFSGGDGFYFKDANGKILNYKKIDNPLKYLNEKTNDYYILTQTSHYSKILKSGNITALLDDRGNLYLDGYFAFSQYEGKKTVYNNKRIASGVKDFDLNENSLMFIKNSSLYGMGWNQYGQLGDDTQRNRYSPVKIMDNVSFISVGKSHSCVVDIYNNLFTFGDNSYSQLCDYSANASCTPIKVFSGVKSAFAGNNFTVFLTITGEVYVAGKNDKGQLATGSKATIFKPQKVLSNVVKCDVSENSVAVLKDDGSLYAWGENKNNKLGIAKADNIYWPNKVLSSVYDFSFSDNGLGVILKNRNIVVSGCGVGKKFDPIIKTICKFKAKIPEKDRVKYKNEDKKETAESTLG